MKKYELTDETIEVEGVKLHRVKALIDFAKVKAEVYDNTWVYDDAKVHGRHIL